MRISQFLFFVFSFTSLHAQQGSYKADLEALKSKVQKLPSFKVQIRGNKLEEYNSLYSRLMADSTHDVGSFEYFHNLSQLIFPLSDNHLSFSQTLYWSKFQTQSGIDSFLQSKTFEAYRSININTDSLKAILSKQPTDSIEGIYHYENHYSVGLFKSAANEYTGVVIETKTPFWKNGQIAMRLYQFGPNLYKAIYGHPKMKSLMLQPIEKYQNHMLVNSHFYLSLSESRYSKFPDQKDLINLPEGSPRFEFKKINDSLQYLLVRTFQANKKTAAESEKFFDSIKTSLTAGKLILDLRNNEGGNEYQMERYLKLLKQYVKKGKLYVLINNGTLSQSEIFTLKLKKIKNVTTIGQTTRGMLAYGSNYGKKELLPGKEFEFHKTDMNTGRQYLQYEDVGIKPDIFLKGDKDLLEEAIEVCVKS